MRSILKARYNRKEQKQSLSLYKNLSHINLSISHKKIYFYNIDMSKNIHFYSLKLYTFVTNKL